MMAYRHGLRASELIAVRWDQVDLKAGLLHVARLKHGSASTHPLRGPELRALRAWKRKQGDATTYVFTSLRGGPTTRRTAHHVVLLIALAAMPKGAGSIFPTSLLSNFFFRNWGPSIILSTRRATPCNWTSLRQWTSRKPRELLNFASGQP
jgi:integrase